MQSINSINFQNELILNKKSWNSGNTWEDSYPDCAVKGARFYITFWEKIAALAIMSKWHPALHRHSHSIFLLKSPAVIYFDDYVCTDVMQCFSWDEHTAEVPIWNIWKKFSILKCVIINLDMAEDAAIIWKQCILNSQLLFLWSVL